MLALKRSALLLLSIACLLAAGDAWAQTGKVSGRVTDAVTGEPLPGVNITVDGTMRGAATDFDGYYVITNVPPGRYEVVVSFIGYKRVRMPDVQVSTDFTTTLDFALEEEVIQGEEVVVVAQQEAIQRDLTSTRAVVTAEEIEKLPVESVADIVNLQGGVVASGDGGFHVRGGRSDEVAVLVDGMSVVDPFNGLAGVQVEPSSIQEVEVISGTFNAEYGQAMSGVVNVVTKDGAPRLEASASAYLGSYLTTGDELFYNLGFDGLDGTDVEDVTLNVAGPIAFVPGLSFFATGRYFNSDGSIYGLRVFNPDDVVGMDLNALGDDPESQIEALRQAATGDSAYVPMNPYRRYSFNTKLVYNRPSFKVSYALLADDHFNRYYDHSFRLNPDGLANHYRNDWLHQGSVTHVISNRTFYTLKGSYNTSNYEGHVYEDPADPRYVGPFVGSPVSAYTYRYGGQQNTFYERTTETAIAQLKLSSQVNRHHQIGAGVEGRFHRLRNRGFAVQQGGDDGLFAVPQLGTLYHQAYEHTPREFAAYVQDKMEYDIMIINLGVRADYFDPNAAQPADLRNPEGNPNFPGVVAEGQPEMEAAEPSFQLSPRLGASFPITASGAIHFAYGHFFQTPTFENLYQNSLFFVEKNRGLSTITGNPALKPQSTVMYEAGIQQQVLPHTVVDFTVYYRDIRNLLGTEIIGTYDGYRYARFINRDYGNVRGFILSLDRRFADRFSAKLDYTYQIAEGNASDPLATFQDNQTDPPIESEKKVVPLDWDQRHTLYASAAYGTPGDWTVGLNFRLGSGMPYTTDRTFNPVSLRFENDGRRPMTTSLDLRVEKSFDVGPASIGAFAIVYNVLDTRNEYGVYGSTGRANRDRNAIFYEESVRAQNGVPVIGLNTVQGFIDNPALYSEPRQLRFGLNVEF